MPRYSLYPWTCGGWAQYVTPRASVTRFVMARAHRARGHLLADGEAFTLFSKW